MSCKNLCELKYKAERPRYVEGQRRCQVCMIFIKWDGFWCPCCNFRLRTKPRKKVNKEKLRKRSAQVIPLKNIRAGGKKR